MVVDPDAAKVFANQMEDHSNRVCCDCGTEDASWASISHGIYLSIGAAGLHRSLGVKVSFVQSTTMDSWRPLHLRMMELGGNRRFSEFLKLHGVPQDMPIREKYNTRAAKWYRENLRAEAEGSEPPAPLLVGTGHLLDCDSATEAQQVLDKVFARAPCSASMTSGGVKRSQTKHNHFGCRFGPKLPRSAPGFPVLQHSGTLSPKSAGHAQCKTPDLGLDRWLPLMPLPNLLTSLRSSQCPTAKRLQTLSSGKMEGFGSDDCLAKAASSQMMSQADPVAAPAA